MRHPFRLALLVLAALMFLSLDHGLPHRYLPDDSLVRCALGMAKDVQELGPVGLVPPAGQYTTYWYLNAYVDLAAIGAVYAAGRALGSWDGAGAFEEALFSNPGIAWLPARIVSALFGLLLAYGVYRAARELCRGRHEAALAGLLAGSSQLLVLYAHTSRPWAPMMGWFGLSLWLSARALRKRTARSLAAAWLAAGAAAASFQVGALVLAFPALAWALLLLRERERRGALLGGGTAAAGLGLAVILGLGVPYFIVHGGDDAHGLITDQEVVSAAAAADAAPVTVELGGQAFRPQEFGGARFAVLARSWFGNEPVLLALGLLGLGFAARGRRRADTLWLVHLPLLCFGAAFLLYNGSHVRYLLPATALLAVPAAACLVRLARAGTATQLVALLLVALPLVQAARLDQLLGREDTRTLALEQFGKRLPPDARVAVDALGSRYAPPLIPRADALREFAALLVEHPETLWMSRTEQRQLERAEAGLPEPESARWLLAVSRFYATDVYAADGYQLGAPLALEDFLARWRVDHFLQVERLPDDERRAPLSALLAARGSLVAELSPTGAGAPARAQLPTDMDFPLTELWSQERPGPWLRLWRLAPKPEAR